MSGSPMYLAMPPLPDKAPYMTAIAIDKESGASLRTYRGSTFDTNQTATVTQALWGKTLARDYAMRIPYPIQAAQNGSLLGYSAPGSIAARKQQAKRVAARKEVEAKRNAR